MTDAVAEEKLKVFISYWRRDSAALADELVGDVRLLASHRSSIVTTLLPARTGGRVSVA
jgi:hypothetical protein